MKVVIPYIHFTGIELKYCLRGIEKFVPDAEIILIGDCPKWVTNVTHIPFKDHSDQRFKERNIFQKILLVNDDFLFFNDDHFLLANVTGYHYSGMLSQRIIDYPISNNCRQTVQNTFDLYGDIPNYYRHSPFFIERENLEPLTKLDWSKKCGYCVKSIYAHINQIQGQDYPDLKIREPLMRFEIKRLIEGRPYFSTGDHSINRAMISVLNELYPNKSIFEK